MTPLEDAIESLTAMIAFPTVSDTSNVEISQWIAARMQSIGMQTRIESFDDLDGVTKANLVAVLEPSERDGESGGLAYFAHTDVVPVDGWVGVDGGSPWTATLNNGRMYGRGSCDMKGSIAAMLAAVATVDRQVLRRPLWIVCTADEEVGFAGVKHFVESDPLYHEMIRRQPAVIIGEPTNGHPVLAHKGIRGLRFVATGRAGHSSTDTGVNANRGMATLLAMFVQIEDRCREDSTMQDEHFEPSHLSFNFGISDAMSAINITPGRSVAWCSWRSMSGIDDQWIIDQLADVSNRLGIVMSWIIDGEPLSTDVDDPVLRQIESMFDSSASRVSYGTDGGQLTDLRHRIVLGPGNIEQAHTVDEFIELAQLETAIERNRRLIKHFCVSD